MTTPEPSSASPLLPDKVSWTGKSIVRFSLHQPAKPHARLDVLPFVLLYMSWLYVVLIRNMSQFFTVTGFVVCAILHILAFLMQHWSVKARTFMSWNSVKKISASSVREQGIHAFCQPREHRGKAQLVPLQVDDQDRIYFIFQKRTFEYNTTTNCFEKVLYPSKLRLQQYASSARSTLGLSDENVVQGLTRFGTNKLEMPAPTFAELYKESLLAPFFVFQVFCIFLWLLDEYWKYSLMTLVMMLMFEATVVTGRLRSLRELRGMRNPSLDIHVYRSKKWSTISSLDLLPGDIISIARGRDPSHVVPCDLLILSGSAVVNEAMLTGESVPLMKEAITTLQESEMDDPLSIKNKHKSHVLFGGTRVLTHNSGVVSDVTPSTKPPDNGCICYVLRTGFGSSQGKLMRTILYSTESVTANSSEAALFILFLLVFALAASGYVLYHRYTEEPGARYKLLLRCVLIITAVVPPELPMQLALAVNTSLIALVRNMVFCTEPFRIPFAGKIDICCFDKTGTLTTDSINAAGVALPPQENAPIDPNVQSEGYVMVPVPQASVDASLVLAACHSLVYVDNELIGDPLELAALDSVEWSYGRSGTCVPKRGGSSAASGTILTRFRFASALQRMSVIAKIGGNTARNGARVLVKGSPEAVGGLLKDGVPPPMYKETARRLARGGMRVLALAYKDLDDTLTSSQLMKISREEAESELIFVGFVCFECPLRADSRKVIRILKKSSHMVTMITGDATLTGAHVATQVGMCSNTILVLDKSEVNPGTLEWFSANSGKRKKRFVVETVKTLAQEFDLCVSGPALQMAIEQDMKMKRVLHHIKVFARMSPDMKETVLTSLKETGFVTLMCGDGTNDVGALKQAHVGVALLSAPPSTNNNKQRQQVAGNTEPQPQSIENSSNKSGSKNRNSNLRQRKKGTKPSATGSSTAITSENAEDEANVEPKNPKDLQKEAYKKKINELTASLGDSDDQPPLVKLGDASIASPFTSRRMTIDSCVAIIRQGRCTLATTLQMYQILALNCLISAYSLSVLYLQGVVLGDKQMTITGIVLAIASFMVSRSKPLKKLSPERPATSVFAPGLFLSMMGQFAIHVIALIACTRYCEPYIPPGYVPDPEAEFSPSLINSVVFLLSIAQQVSVYVLNYKGRPFMQGIRDNKMLLHSLLAAFAILFICAVEISPELNEFMELVPWPSTDLQIKICGVIVFDLIGSFLVDRIFIFLFTKRVEVAE